MRIIGGELRRRPILGPAAGTITRPMPDHVREAVFNLLRGHCEEQTVIDAFAGCGAIGLEAISRGAARCVFIEKDRKAARVIQQNLDALGVADRGEVIVGDALSAATLARLPAAHLVFSDPPYDLTRTPEAWDRVRRAFAGLIARLDRAGFGVLRTPHPFLLTPAGGNLEPGDLAIDGAEGPETRPYGTTAVHLYMRASTPSPSDRTETTA
ncbi:MAG: RsmD family RNA methyltransferase [Phycisphaerales bacterium JB037]